MNTLVGNNGIMGNEYRPPALVFGNFVTRNMNTTNTGLSNSIISTVNHYSTTTTIVLTITPSTHVHTYNYNHVCYMCSAHVQILQKLVATYILHVTV